MSTPHPSPPKKKTKKKNTPPHPSKIHTHCRSVCILIFIDARCYSQTMIQTKIHVNYTRGLRRLPLLGFPPCFLHRVLPLYFSSFSSSHVPLNAHVATPASGMKGTKPIPSTISCFRVGILCELHQLTDSFCRNLHLPFIFCKQVLFECLCSSP